MSEKKEDLMTYNLVIKIDESGIKHIFGIPNISVLKLERIEKGSAISSGIATLAPSPSETTVMSGRPQGIREFVKALPLKNNYEKIAAIVYHAIKITNKPWVTVKEVEDWFGLCGFQKPTKMAFAMFDARRKYDYVESKGRDQWTIKTSGENLIIDLLEKMK